MAGNPQVLGLLEEMLDSGKTPEEVCRVCPELIPEVRERWQEFCRIDAQIQTLLPGVGASPAADTSVPVPLPPHCHRFLATKWRRCSAVAAWG
jgi:hypothetical protein